MTCIRFVDLPSERIFPDQVLPGILFWYIMVILQSLKTPVHFHVVRTLVGKLGTADGAQSKSYIFFKTVLSDCRVSDNQNRDACEWKQEP